MLKVKRKAFYISHLPFDVSRLTYHVLRLTSNAQRIYMFKIIAILLVCAAFVNLTEGQQIIEGIVKDAETGQGLPIANIQIEKTYRGTITNEDGRFTLGIKTFPVTIIVSYIGYSSERVILNENPKDDLVVFLVPSPIRMPEIVIDGEDPAVAIMKKVIAQKQIWWNKLKTYKAEAYCRTTFYNDSGIFLISETLSEAYWDKDKGPRDIVKSKRQTAETMDIFLGTVSHFPNFYHDNVMFKQFKMINVIHPDAIKYYYFRLEKQRMLDDKNMFIISVKPKTKLQPVFEGRISVLDEDFTLLSVELKPANHVVLPVPIEEAQYSYTQKFSNFGKEFWLPVSLMRESDVAVNIPGLNFDMKFKDLYEVKNYEINIPLQDSLFDNDIVSIDSTAFDDKSKFVETNNIVVPLSNEEEKAYETIDSTIIFMEALNPRGFLAKILIKAEEEARKEAKQIKNKDKKKYNYSFTPEPWFNRTDGLHLGLMNTIDYKNRIKINFLVGYKTASKKWAYGSRFCFKSIKFEYFQETDLRYRSNIYPKLFTGFLSLCSHEDYYDYYWNKRMRGEIFRGYKKINTRFIIGINNEQHTSLKKQTDYDIFGRDFIQRENPQIDNGYLRSVDFKIEYGSNYIPFGVVGQRRAVFSVEHSSAKILSSDFNFTRYVFAIDWRINTFLKRRFMPNSLDIRFIAGTYTGDIPLQRFGAIDANLGIYNSFGALKSLQNRPYEGGKYFAIFCEHNFRTVPFELLGLTKLAKKGVEIILHGASGRTWISSKRLSSLNYLPQYTNSFHHEIGISINKLFYLLRLNFTQRLDKKEFYVGISVPRFF